MTKKTFALPILLLAIFVSSCDRDPSGSAAIEGDYADEDFLLARADADTALAEIRFDEGGPGDWLFGDPGDIRLRPADYDSASGWHSRVWEYEGDFVEVTVADSFRFTALDGGHQRRRDSTTNVLERRLNRRFEYAPQPDSLRGYGLRTRERDMRWTGLADTVTTLDGGFHRRWIGDARGRYFSKEVEGELDGVRFFTADLRDGRPAHPFAGSFVGQMLLDVETPNREAHVEANLTVTFYREGDQFCYHARLERGDNWWEWDRCFPGD